LVLHDGGQSELSELGAEIIGTSRKIIRTIMKIIGTALRVIRTMFGFTGTFRSNPESYGGIIEPIFF